MLRAIFIMDSQGKTIEVPPSHSQLNQNIFHQRRDGITGYGSIIQLTKLSATTWTNLAIETERGIRLPNDAIQDSFRIIADKKLKQIRNNNNNCSIIHKTQTHVLKNLKQKITNGKVIIGKADKGKTILIIHTQD